ncbi:probable glutathione S-transferase [Phoenix dactylifera]|uniref:glutathione transferase n=1 Tax=Phoenix dactylifera TaxID=42345 RepID=A0A8B7BLV5_PHODC|nr:probable glutathione S-transferase [Phoenix dactylifera]
MAEEVKVFGHWTSPFSCRVGIALRLKGVPYEYIEEDLSNKSSLLLEYNPVHKKVPVLVHGGRPIAESLVVLEYIEETWRGNPMLPQDPHRRAMARFWTKFVDEKCMPIMWKSLWSEGEMQQKLMEETNENLSILERELDGKKFFGGNSIGLVDIAANFLSYWTEVLQEVAGISLFNVEKHPILFKWANEFMSSDAVKECLPPKDELLSHFQAMKEAMSATKARQN